MIDSKKGNADGLVDGKGKDGRDIGYGVQALCDQPDCDKQMDRG